MLVIRLHKMLHQHRVPNLYPFPINIPMQTIQITDISTDNIMPNKGRCFLEHFPQSAKVVSIPAKNVGSKHAATKPAKSNGPGVVPFKVETDGHTDMCFGLLGACVEVVVLWW